MLYTAFIGDVFFMQPNVFSPCRPTDVHTICIHTWSCFSGPEKLPEMAPDDWPLGFTEELGPLSSRCLAFA